MVTESNPSSLAGMIERMEREAFEKAMTPDDVQSRRHQETGEYTDSGMASAWVGWQARAAMNSKCRGVAHPGCNYLAPCGSICDKCGAKT